MMEARVSICLYVQQKQVVLFSLFSFFLIELAQLGA